MSEVTVGSLGSILPEIVLLVGGLLILLLDTAMGNKNDSGRSYMAISVLFLFVGLVGVIAQFGRFSATGFTAEPFTALSVIDVDAFGLFVNVCCHDHFPVFVGRILCFYVHVAFNFGIG